MRARVRLAFEVSQGLGEAVKRRGLQGKFLPRVRRQKRDFAGEQKQGHLTARSGQAKCGQSAKGGVASVFAVAKNGGCRVLQG